MSKQSTNQKLQFQNATGPIRIRMTNDYLFKATLQSDSFALAGLSAALLHLPPENIQRVEVTNPFILGEEYEEKNIVLDVKVCLNNNTRLDLEMQVANYHDWPERSTYYACRNFARLHRGEEYHDVKPSHQIGLLDFFPFPDHLSFYSTYRLRDDTSGRLYTDKFSIRVLELNNVSLATEEDKRYNIDKWARLYKAETWEDVKMIASEDPAIFAAANTIYKLSEDERIREQCEAREDFLRRELATRRELEELNRLKTENAQQAAEIARLRALLAEKEK
ncbi:MAG: Rpn family recombination-promoting nuclease/putative transposase [Lachnospiraceae bacterium]|nr:Rpn family recombination-promoting nuclease/putative transposase [Lachnospiraceae bacterium]